jgi:hypothetical protein
MRTSLVPLKTRQREGKSEAESVQNLEHEIRVFKFSNIPSRSLARFWKLILTDGKLRREDFNLTGLNLIARLGNPSNSVVKRCPKKNVMGWIKVFSKELHHSWSRFCD